MAMIPTCGFDRNEQIDLKFYWKNLIEICNCAFTWNTLINTPLFKNSNLNKRHPKIETVSSVNDRTLPLIAAKFTKTIRKTSPNYERIH